MTEPQLLTVPEVAELLRISRTNAYGLVKAGAIPHVRIGVQIRVPRDKLAAWLEKEGRHDQ